MDINSKFEMKLNSKFGIRNSKLREWRPLPYEKNIVEFGMMLKIRNSEWI